jgi:hypothetical protein
METSDTVRGAPTAIMTIPKFPELPRVRAVESGSVLEDMVREELGGDPEARIDPDESGVSLGVRDVFRRGELSVHVHTHPRALEGLQLMVEKMQAEMNLMKMLDESGLSGRVLIISGPPGVCICGQCEMRDGDGAQEVDIDDERLA